MVVIDRGSVRLFDASTVQAKRITDYLVHFQDGLLSGFQLLVGLLLYRLQNDLFPLGERVGRCIARIRIRLAFGCNGGAAIKPERVMRDNCIM